MQQQIFNTIIALIIMLSGFTLYALFYFLQHKTWNGFKDKQKILVAVAIFFIVSSLLVNVPEVAGALKMLSGLDANIENSKIGFLTMGFAIAVMLTSRYKVKTKKEVE